MTELQIGLIGLGAAAVAAVFGYNKWQELRQRKIAEALLKPKHEDVLFAGSAAKAESLPSERAEPVLGDPLAAPASERREPVLGDAVEIAADPANAQAAPVVPSIMTSTSSSDDEEAPELPVGQVPGSLLDPRLEFIVAMELVDPAPGALIVHAQAEALQRVGKPVHWVAFNERNREWERIDPQSESLVRRLRVGLQLVDRTGPASDADVAIFTEAMHALADQLLAVAEAPDGDLLEQAAELDRFCAAVDLEIGVNLISRGVPFSGTKIRALAEAAGMVLGEDGAFIRFDDAGRPQFALQNYETTRFTTESMRNLATHGLTFVLDVPRVDHGERVFVQMVDLAKRFGETLQGTLVDDNRQPLNDLQLDHIRREFIGKPQANMAAFGLPAGCAQALRLFS